MTITTFTNGLGSSVAPSLGLAYPLQTSGTVYYVSSVTGSTGASYGRDRTMPYSSLVGLIGAITLASNDIIVLMSGHTEVVATETAITVAGVTILGEGTASSGKPNVSLQLDHATADIFQVDAGGAYSQFINIYFPAPAQAAAGRAINVNAAEGVRIYGCYFECNANSDATTVLPNGSGCRIEACTFVSTATAASALPISPVKTAGAITGLQVIDSVFDGGTYGFSDGSTRVKYGLDASAGAVTSFRGQGISLLRGADILLHASSVGYCNVQTATGSSHVEW